MTPRRAFVYDVIGKMAGSNKRWRQMRFEPLRETGVKKIINGNVSSEYLSWWFASEYGATSSIQNCVSPLVLRLQNAQEQYICKTYSLTTSHPASHTLRRKWQFQFGNIQKIPKIATSNVLFSRMADRISAKFCMTIRKIKPNPIF